MTLRIPVAIAFVVGAVLGTAASSLHPGTTRAGAAPTPETVGGVHKAGDRTTRQAPHGKARITPLARGRSAFLGILELDGGVAVPEHADPTEEIIHVLEGSGTITIDGTSHPVAPGDTILMPAGATVTYANGPAPMKAVQVFAGPGPADKYIDWPAVE